MAGSRVTDVYVTKYA